MRFKIVDRMIGRTMDLDGDTVEDAVQRCAEIYHFESGCPVLTRRMSGDVDGGTFSVWRMTPGKVGEIEAEKIGETEADSIDPLP